MDNPPFGESIIYFIVVFSNKPLQQFQEGRFFGLWRRWRAHQTFANLLIMICNDVCFVCIIAMVLLRSDAFGIHST